MSYGATDITAEAAKGQVGSEPSRRMGDDATVSQSQSQSQSAGARPEASEEDPIEQTGVRQKLKAFYERNIGLFFVFLAQVFGSIMTTTTRLLETAFDIKFHALQIIFVRMFATTVLGSLYMWYNKVPDFPFGNRGVRWLLVLRGTAGFIGLFCSYYSLTYLNISDATVINFLVPTLTAFVAFIVLKEPFTINEAIAGLIAFAGVLFIARPTFLFPRHEAAHPQPEQQQEADALMFMTGSPKGLVPAVPTSPEMRTLAVVCAVVGAFSAATAYATIRIIGKRAHSLVSVNYFAVMATLGSCLIILVHPDLEFRVPQSAAQWILLVTIGVAGFLLQFLLTEGLKREKAGRATNLIYTQIVFALVLERVVWGTTPRLESFLGSILIIGSAIWVSLQKNKAPAEPKKPQLVDEESSLLGRGGDSGASWP